MLELSIALPIKVQNGGLFISRGVGRHPARKLTSWEIIFVEKGTLTIQEENTVFEVRAGETLLLWPDRRHVGVAELHVNILLGTPKVYVQVMNFARTCTKWKVQLNNLKWSLTTLTNYSYMVKP
jgi:hypothetical protein